MIFSILILLLTEAAFLADRFSDVKKRDRTKRFWRFTWIIGILIFATTLTPLLQSAWDNAQRVGDVKKRAFNELLADMEILDKWRVILNRNFPGVETLRTSMYRSGSINDLPDELEEKLRDVYTQMEDLDRRLDDYRGTAPGYQNAENVRRTKNAVNAVTKSAAAVLEEMDPHYKYEKASDEKVVQKHIVQFRDGVATGNTISADSGGPAIMPHYVMVQQPPPPKADKDTKDAPK